mgnify:CR=1 FL=1
MEDVDLKSNTVAKVSPGWVVRMVIAGVAFFGFACWSLYDGLVKYPGINERVDQYQQLEQEKRLADWEALAKEKGWDPKPMRESQRKSDWDIRTQFIMAAICAPIGLVILVRLGLTVPRKLYADDDGMVATSGKRIPYDAITAIDKKKWDRKAIAVVHYEMNGQKGTAKVDDWIFKGAAQVLQVVEGHLSSDIAGVGEQAAPEEKPEQEPAEEPEGGPREAEPEQSEKGEPEEEQERDKT